MRLMSAVHPTTNQKRVLAKIAAAPTPVVAGTEISKDANLVAARNLLMKLGLITFADGSAEMTEKGQQVAADENIVDQSGELSSVGQELAYTDAQGNKTGDQAAATPPAPPPGADQAMPQMGGGQQAAGGDDGLSLESFSLLKELLG